MKAKIDLNYNNTYKWFSKDDIYVIGSIYVNNKFLKNRNFIEFIKENKNNLKETLNKINGFFAIVIREKDEITMISDVMRTFPLFYSISNNQLTISDNIDVFQNAIIDNDKCNELINLRYIVGSNTIYENVKQMSSNEIVAINNKLNIKKEKYYNFNIIKSEETSKKELINKIDNTFNDAIKRLIQYADGKTLVVPLSGGYDSRQILIYLHNHNYKNIICYTYGKEVSGEALISKQLAECLDYKWIFVKYQNSKMKKKYYNQADYKNVISYISRGFSSPIVQEWYAMDYLSKNNLIPKDSVVVPGFTGDALSGSHLEESFFNKKKYKAEEIINKIVNYNYIKVIDSEECFKRIDGILDINSNFFNLDDAVNYYNKYDFEERQVKYITNAVRIYEYYGYEWYLPFWDKEYINLWRAIPLKHKFNRILLKEYFDDKYRRIMTNIPVYQKKEKKRTKNYVKKVYNLLISYYNDNMNLYGYYKYRVYIHQILFDKNISYDYIFGKDYIDFIRRK